MARPGLIPDSVASLRAVLTFHTVIAIPDGDHQDDQEDEAAAEAAGRRVVGPRRDPGAVRTLRTRRWFAVVVRGLVEAVLETAPGVEETHHGGRVLVTPRGRGGGSPSGRLNQLVDNGRSRPTLVVNHEVEKEARWPTRCPGSFAALADPTRRDLVARLTDGDATVGDLAAPYDVSLQAVSKHLKVLEEAGLVTPQPRRPAPTGAPGSRGVRPDDPWIERYRRRAEERYQRLDDVLADLDTDEHDDRPAPQEGTAS